MKSTLLENIANGGSNITVVVSGRVHVIQLSQVGTNNHVIQMDSRSSCHPQHKQLKRLCCKRLPSQLALGSSSQLFVFLVVCHHAENGLINMMKLVVDCPLVITSISGTLLQTRSDQNSKIEEKVVSQFFAQLALGLV